MDRVSICNLTPGTEQSSRRSKAGTALSAYAIIDAPHPMELGAIGNMVKVKRLSGTENGRMLGKVTVVGVI